MADEDKKEPQRYNLPSLLLSLTLSHLLRSPSTRRLSRERSNSAPGTPDKSPPRSRGKSPRRRRSRERSGSRSNSPKRERRSRSRERSPRRRSMSRERAPSGSPDHDKFNGGHVLYFAGLHPQTREQDLEDICSKYGTVTSVNIIFDPRSGESRGFGFICMGTEKESDEVIAKLNGRELDGKPLTIEKARRAGPRKATPGRYLGKLNNRSRFGAGSRYDRGRYGDYGGPYDRSPPRYRRSPPRFRDDYSPGRSGGGYSRRSPPRGGNGRRSPGYDYDRRYR